MKLRSVLKAKLHAARVTEANLEYEGSITIDEDLMDMVGLSIHEFVLVSNMNNGERFETYVIPGKRGKGDICLNGAAARKGLAGDRIIVLSRVYVTEDEIKDHKPKIIILSEKNEPREFH
jgi:aspartate 1-decarboxylase